MNELSKRTNNTEERTMTDKSYTVNNIKNKHKMRQIRTLKRNVKIKLQRYNKK